MFTTDSLRTVAIDGQLIRVAIRPAAASARDVAGHQVPLLIINGIGASLELLAPFVDALDPAIEVVRFDVPGVCGSPLPVAPGWIPVSPSRLASSAVAVPSTASLPLLVLVKV